MTWRAFSFVDKGPGLVEAIEAAGIAVRQRGTPEGGVWECSDVERAEAIVASFDPVPGLKAKLIEATKAEAQARIYAIVPLWKQNNLLAQATLLNAKGRENWTDADQAAWDDGGALWDRVAAIRTASDLVEADIQALTDWGDLHAFDVAGSARWPE